MSIRPIIYVCSLAIILLILLSIVNDEKLVNGPPVALTPNQANELYSKMKELHDFCEKNNIWYCACSGTVLGAVRHGKIIPWDDDIDVMIKETDISKIRKHFPSSVLKWGIIKLYTKDTFIDIFPVKVKKNKVTFSRFKHRLFFRKEWLENTDRKLVKFGPIDIYIPKQAKAYLDRAYPEWNIKYKIQPGHGKHKLQKREILIDK